jgi:hypothetical protein
MRQVGPAEQEPAEAELAQVLERGSEDGGHAEAGQEGRRMQALEAAEVAEHGVQPGDLREDAASALMTGTSAAPRQSAVQTRRGARAKPRTKGAVEPMKLRAMSPKPATRPIGRMARLRPGDGDEGHERPVDGAAEAVAHQQHAREREGHHLHHRRRAPRPRRPPPVKQVVLDVEREAVVSTAAPPWPRELVKGERGDAATAAGRSTSSNSG